MAIQAGNLSLHASAVMDDTLLNGGLPSDVVIADGGSNGIFPDVSDLDELGSVKFRKVYPTVETDDTATAMGVNTILSEVPANEAVSVVLFPAASASETQADMVQRLGAFTGTLSQSQLDAISADMYLLRSLAPGDAYASAGAYPVLLAHPATVGAGGASVFAVSQALSAVIEAHFSAGQVLTLVEFYEDAVSKAEAREILHVYPVFPGSATYGMVVEWAAPSSYAVWGAATRFTGQLSGAQRFGTYVIEASTSLGLKRFEFYGASRTTAAVAAGATSIPVASITAGIVPAVLMEDPAAAELLGYPPTALTKSPDGREAIFKAYRRVVIGKIVEQTAVVSAGQTVDLGEADLTWLRVIDHAGAVVSAGYTADLDAGTVTFNSVAGYTQPVTIRARAEDLVQVSGISGNTLQIPASRPLRRAYPAGSVVSSALIHGDRRARVLGVAARATWHADGWADTLANGGAIPARYDTANHPIELTNWGTVTDRIRLLFTNTTTFSIISEQFGVLGSGTTGADCAPINPANGKPLFTLRAAGWGLGWGAGNLLMLDLEGVQPPLWVLRCIQMAPHSTSPSSFELETRMNVDRP